MGECLHYCHHRFEGTGSGCSLLARLTVYPNIVHQHGLWKGGRGVRVSRPVATDCHIQYDKEWMIEFPDLVGMQVRMGARDVQIAIDIEPQCVWLPLQGEQ